MRSFDWILSQVWFSSVDPSWKRGYSRLHTELLIHYQRLPLGSTSKNATRINIRVDAPPVRASMNDLHNVQWHIWSDSGKLYLFKAT